MRKAAELANLTRKTVYEWRGEDEDFAAAWEAAIEEGTDRLEDEMMRRARDGLLRFKFHGKTGTPLIDPRTGEPYVELEYSDQLAMFLAKARRPEKYRDRYEVQTTGETKITVNLRLKEPKDGEGEE